MANSDNPYQAPAADLDAAQSACTEAFTATMVQALKGTKPWVRFLSILGFVLCGLTVLFGLMFAVMAVFMPELSSDSGLGVFVIMVVLYVAIGAIGMVPALQLHRYANAIASVERGAGTPGIEDALGRQRSFWRTAGIMTLIVMGLYIAAIFVAVVVSIFGTMSNSF